MPDFRRGAAAIAKAQEKPEGGTFRPFTPMHFWKNDQDSKYLLFLNSLEDIPTVDMIGFIPIKKKKKNGDSFTTYEQVIARTDSALEEDSDPMVDDWQGKPRQTNIAVAVELEPVFEEVKGRKRPVGFEVKTTEFDRRIRGDDDKLTDETETVVAPVVGFVTQSPHNFFNIVAAYDNNNAPIEETALRITKIGVKTDTAFTVDGFPDQEIDLSGLLDYVDGISYLGTQEEIEKVVDEIADMEDADALAYIGEFLLDKRLEELCDRERYDELYNGITETLDKFGGGSKKTSSKPAQKRERPTRRSQRRSSETPADDAPAEDAVGPQPVDDNATEPASPEEKPARKPRTPREPAGEDATNAKLAGLKARQAERKAKASA